MEKQIYRIEPETNHVMTADQAWEKYKGAMPDAGVVYTIFDTWPEAVIELPYDSEADTLKHIKRVNELLIDAAQVLLKRAQVHDTTKLGPIEKPLFDEMTPLLKNLVYGSKEYTQSLNKLKVALDHHYANNSHHPEHYSNSINGMDLFDLLEMVVDWKAATERNKDGDIRKSIEINGKRFNMSEQLQEIFVNTVNSMNF